MLINTYQEKGVDFIKVLNNTSLDVTFCNLGASIYQIKYLGDYMIMSTKNVDDFLKPEVYYGKTIGRVAGRIKDSVLWVDNVPYFLATNVGQTNVCLHGGMFGLSTCRFNYEYHMEGHNFVLTFTYHSMHLESGFPGEVDFKIIYVINELTNNIHIELHAVSDRNTIMNLTNHCYFCLGENTNKNLSLQMDSNRFVEVDSKTFVPLCEKEVDGIRDFRNGLSFDRYIDDQKLAYLGGYDQHFCFSSDGENVIHLKGKKYFVDICSNYSGAQIYSDNKINVPSLSSPYLNRRSVAIELEDSHVSDRSLKANVPYSRYIDLCFGLNSNRG